MRAGLLTEEITVLQPQKTIDAYGSKSATQYVPLFTTKARVRYLKGQKETANQEVILYYTLEIIVRSYHMILDDYLIEYKGERYYIIAQDKTQKDQITLIVGKYNE